MVKRIALVLTFGFLLLYGNRVKATHIVGAELYYECLNPATGQYEITLKLYRDCINGQAPYDQFITLFIFNSATSALFQTINVPIPPNTPQIQPDNWGPCVAVIPNICVQEGIYTTTVTLPSNSFGYTLGWARCCRNQAITNLANPLNEGITFLATIPPNTAATCNTMPTFDQVPPIFLCVNQQFAFDHSATDADGDSLVYALTNPYTGLNAFGLGAGNPQNGGNQPVVDPLNNPMGAPPYNNVIFAPGYSFTDPFGSGNFVLDPQTGFITVTPTQTGIFVFSVSVFEYRNGILLSENRRDFQIHVINCLPQGQPPVITHDLTGLNFSNDTIFVTGGVPFCYDITVADPVPTDFSISYTVSAPFGNGSFIPPAATYTFSGFNPIAGEVCWTPACAYDGQVVQLVIGAYDPGDCENISNVFDTVWVSISVPPNLPPVITPNYAGLTVSGDTIIIPAEIPFCFNAQISDPNVGDQLIAYPLSPIFAGAGAPTFTVSGTNPLNVEICWEAACSYEGLVVPLTFGGQDTSLCSNNAAAQKTVWIKVLTPPNQPPGIVTSLAGNVFSNDTIFVSAQQNLCFNFTGSDQNPADLLTLITVSPIFTAPGGPAVTVTGSNPLQGQVCWTPGCQYENQVVALVFGVQDPGACSNIGKAFDTVYVKVSVPPNDPPLITANLAGNVFNGDTIFVTALQNLCYSFTAADPNAANQLTIQPLSPVFTQPGAPVITFTGTNPVNGQVCWTPSCAYAGLVVPLVIRATDNGACSSSKNDRDTVFVKVNLPPNDPPAIDPDFGSLNTNADTIYADATEGFCFDVLFSDINSVDSLEAYTLSPVFTGANAATFTVTGTNPLQGQVCWTPACENEGQIIPMVLGVDDNGSCNNIKSAKDTIYVKISDPQTIAPIVTHDLSGNNFSGDTIYVDVGDGACYEFYIADQTPDNGLNYAYDFESVFGSSLQFTTVQIITRNDSIIGTVCFDTDCSNGGSYYRSIVTGLDKETCPPFKQASDTVFFKINTSFLSFAGNDTFFCEGSGGVQLGVTPIGGQAPYYYQWYCDNPGNCGFSIGNGNVQNPVANPTDTTTYYVQITDNNGCTSEIDGITVNVNRLPIVDAGPDQNICEDSPGVQLLATVTNPLEAPGPYVWTWLPAAGLNNPATPDPYVNPDTTTIYTVIVGSANGCTSANTTLDTLSTVEVRVNPRPEVEAGPDRDICLGETTQLLGFASLAGPNYSYIWTPATGLNDSSIQAPLASPDQTVTYFLVAWSNGCPSIADSVTIRVHTIPTVQSLPDYEVCAGDSVQLMATASGDPEATGYTFAWTPATGLSDPTIRDPKASPAATTIYSVVATSNFDCSSAAVQVKVTVLPSPIAYAGPDTFLCKGNEVQLNGSHTVLGGSLTAPVFYEWTPPDGLSGLFVPDPTAAPTRTTLYTLTVSSGSCSTTDQVLIDVFENVRAAVGADTNRICRGDSVRLFVSGGLGSSSYSWSPAAGLDNPNIASPWASPDTSTTYVLTLSEGVCFDRDSVRIEVNPTPKAEYVSSLTRGCEDLTVSFFQNSGTGISFIWDFGDGTPISNEPDPVHTYTEPGQYVISFTATGAGGCSVSSNEQVIQVTSRGEAIFETDPTPGTPVVLPDAEVRFTSLSQGATQWFWNFGDGKAASIENPVHYYQEAGTYEVLLVITDEGGCIDTTSTIVVIVEPRLFIPNVFTPNTDGVNDAYLVEYNGKGAYELRIFDRWGRLMFSSTTAGAAWDGITSDDSMAPEGVYFYTLSIGEQNFTGNITLLR